MNKREKIEQVKALLEYRTLFAALPREYRDFMLNSIRRNSPAASGEYRFLRITIADVDTGEAIGPAVFTYRKPNDLEALREKVTAIAKWPDELLAGIVIAEVVSSGERLSGQTTALELHRNKKLGGRRLDYMDYFKQWESSGFDNKVRRELREQYICQCKKSDDNAGERFDRTMRRYRQHKSGQNV